MTPTTIRIGPHNVGPDFPPFIIAELSANHAGRFERAMEIVHAAADNGAHAIKLQTFTAATLSIDSSRPEFYIDDPESLWHGRRGGSPWCGAAARAADRFRSRHAGAARLRAHVVRSVCAAIRCGP